MHSIVIIDALFNSIVDTFKLPIRRSMGKEEVLAQIIDLAEKASDEIAKEYLLAEADSIISQMESGEFSLDFLFLLGERMEYEGLRVFD